MEIQKTSKDAYKTIQSELNIKQLEVYEGLKRIEPANNRMIAESLGKPINTITPRIYELRQKKKVGVFKESKDEKTNRKSIFWMTTKPSRYLK